MTENQGYVLAPVPVAPVNETDMVLFPEGLQALKKVAKEVGLDLRGAYLNLDGGFDSAHNRKCIFNAGMIPNIKENPVVHLLAADNSPGPESSTMPPLHHHVRGYCHGSTPLLQSAHRLGTPVAVYHVVSGMAKPQRASRTETHNAPHDPTQTRQGASTVWRFAAQASLCLV
jgi:hypothetical protein